MVKREKRFIDILAPSVCLGGIAIGFIFMIIFSIAPFVFDIAPIVQKTDIQVREIDKEDAKEIKPDYEDTDFIYSKDFAPWSPVPLF